LVEAAVAWRTGQSGAPPDTVRCASHVTRPLGFDCWSFCLLGHRTVRWCTGQSLFTVRCAFWRLSWLLRAGAHCSAFIVPGRRPLALCSRYSAGTPDSPVNYRGAAPRIPEGDKFRLEFPGAPDTIRCARLGHTSVVFCSLCLNPFLVFLLVCCEPLAPVKLII
jgi:hypothetical protein